MARETENGLDRSITRVVDPVEVMEGAGVLVKRSLPSRSVPYEEIDPFLLLDFFDTSHPSFKGQAFPKHPHRGFEIITYILSGEAGHADDFGNKTVIRGGGLQKITAGSGIWHEEGPSPGGQEPTRGLQLWINLAQKDKSVAPGYQVLEPEEVPIEDMGDARVRVLVGEGSPVRLHTPAVYLDVSVESEGTFRQSIPVEYQGFVLVMNGQGSFGVNGAEAREGQFLLLGPGENVRAKAADDVVRFVVAAGKPHQEPVRWNGPFVD